MDDNEVRLKILYYLKSIYDKHTFDSVYNDYLLKDLKNENENLDDNTIIKNIKYLDDKGLIDAKWYLGSKFTAKINSFGIDIIDEYENNLELESKTNIDVVSEIFKEIRIYVDSELEKLNNDILEKLKFIYNDILSREHSHNYSRIAYDCREILKDFMDCIFENNYLENDETEPNRNQTKIKLRYALRNKTKSETVSNLLSERFDYIISYFSELSNYIQKNAHPDNFQVTISDAKSCLIYTYLFINDILKILEL